jgi:hypothetical protein
MPETCGHGNNLLGERNALSNVLERELLVLGDGLVPDGARGNDGVNHRREYGGDHCSGHRKEGGSSEVQDQRGLSKNARLTPVGVHFARATTSPGPTLSK